ncbi:plasmid mobilization protein [Campylobacter hyointestinalis]|uniref:plasmid mobilization protein n=1 Tax=Campylobacter hyointestinalis TaxID=198 RepID=UPI000DCBD060|nr:hypothetical protein [Campylobacter hyointestinalis]RAZ60970.1 hypothetical protein CHL10071_04010 [Campylobacter hyointestinalis subsp. lawsonii]
MGFKDENEFLNSARGGDTNIAQKRKTIPNKERIANFKRKKTITIYFTEEEHHDINQTAFNMGFSASAFIRYAIKEKLDSINQIKDLGAKYQIKRVESLKKLIKKEIK